MVEKVEIIAGECEKEDIFVGRDSFDCDVKINIPKSRDSSVAESNSTGSIPSAEAECRASDDHYWVDGDEVSGHCRKLPEENDGPR